MASSNPTGDPNQDYLDWMANQGGGGYDPNAYPTPGVVSTNPDGTPRVNGGQTSLGITDPGQGTNKTSTQNAPYGLDRYGNPLPPPGAENFATTGSPKYDDAGNLLESSKTLNPAQGPTPSPSSAFMGGDFRGWFNQQVQGKPWTQETLTGLESVLNASGSRLTPANASGERTKIYNPTTGQWVRVGFGEAQNGADPWSVWIGQGNGDSGQNTQGDIASNPTAPFVAGARIPQTQSSVWDSSNPGSQEYQALLDRLKGISTGTTSEFANPNLQINPLTDAIIKPQVDAYDAAGQRSARRYLSAQAERQGSNANINAETRHAAEATGQATAQYQASLAKEELGARRQEIQSALNGEMGMLTERQRSQLQEEQARLDMVEKQYEWDSGLAEKAYEFDSNNQYRNSPLAYL